ncbi:hypothetical protein PGB90_002606 [Kerria lacca]
MVIAEKNSCDEQNLNNVDIDECGSLITPLQYEKIARNIILNGIHINCTQEPIKKEYQKFTERLKTFNDWPHESKISAKALSEAGFIYSHKTDLTTCFYCGGSLFGWADYDEPWIEHAYWFSNCPFVLSIKGKKFVDEAYMMKYALKKGHEINITNKQDCLSHILEKMKEKINHNEKFVIKDNSRDETRDLSEKNFNEECIADENGSNPTLKTKQNSKNSCFNCLGRDCCN